jgi:hypothetical protein
MSSAQRVATPAASAGSSANGPQHRLGTGGPLTDELEPQLRLPAHRVPDDLIGQRHHLWRGPVVPHQPHQHAAGPGAARSAAKSSR